MSPEIVAELEEIFCKQLILFILTLPETSKRVLLESIRLLPVILTTPLVSIIRLADKS